MLQGEDAPAAPPDDQDLDAEPSTGRARRRSQASREQKVGVALAVALGALAATAFDAAPTGHGWIDAVERAALVGVTGLAGARARRWSLVVGATIVTVASLGGALLLSVIALSLVVLQVARDLRDRVWGAAIGVLVALATLSLSVGGFTGASSLVAAAAVVPILWSGYRSSHRSTRRIARWAGFGVLAFGAAGAIVAVVLAARTFGPITDGVERTDDGVTAVRDGRTEQASLAFADASTSLGSAADELGAWWALPSRFVPGVSQNLETVRVVARAGERLTSSAGDIARDVDYQRIRRPDGGIDLDVLAEFEQPVTDAAAVLADARREVRDLRSPWVVPVLAEQVREFDRRIADVADEAAVAAVAVRDAPRLLGRDGERRYLVLLGNPAEMRELGGHLGNWAELVAIDGVLDLANVGRPLELSRPDGDLVLSEEARYPEHVLNALPARFPQNWGATLDFDVAADLSARLFQEATGRPVDGVMYADPSVLAAMLRVIGPVEVPGGGPSVSASDIVEFLVHDQYLRFERPDDGDVAVTELVRVIFDRFTATQLPGPDELSELFAPLRREGRLRFVSLRPEDDPLLRTLGMDGGLPAAEEGVHLVGVTTSNANPSKVDYFLRRDASVDVSWNPLSGALRTTVTVRLTNDAPAEGLPAYVIGNANGFPDGTNTVDLAVLSSSKELAEVTVDGLAVPSGTTEDGEHFRHQTRVSVAPGGTVEVRFVLDDDGPPTEELQLFFAGQPALNQSPVPIAVRTTGVRPVDGPGVQVRGETVTATVPAAERTRMGVRVQAG